MYGQRLRNEGVGIYIHMPYMYIWTAAPQRGRGHVHTHALHVYMGSGSATRACACTYTCPTCTYGQRLRNEGVGKNWGGGAHCCAALTPAMPTLEQVSTYVSE